MKSGYDYGTYIPNRVVKITPISMITSMPHYQCTATNDNQDECMYFQQEYGGESGTCEHAAGIDYVVCRRKERL